MSIDFEFSGTVRYSISYSFGFINRDGGGRNLIPFDELENFQQKINNRNASENGIDLLEDGEFISYDQRETDYSFSKSFDRKKEKMPFVIPVSSPNERSRSRRWPPISEHNDDELTQELAVEMRITRFGVASVNFHHSVDMNQFGVGDEKLNGFVRWEREHAEQCRKRAEDIWQDFATLWNKHTPFEVRPDPQYIDDYSILYVDGITVSNEDDTFPITEIKRENSQLDSELGQDIKKRLAGYSIISLQWPEYSPTFLDQFLEKDLSSTNKEFQFVGLDTAFILNNEENSSESYHGYLMDMVLGLEFLFLIRSSLQLLEELIDEKNDEITSYSTNIVPGIQNPLELMSYYKHLETFDRWLVSIKDWKSLDRHAEMTHFLEFLNGGMNEMWVDRHLNAVDEKVSEQRETFQLRADRFQELYIIILTAILIVLTIGVIVN